MSSFRANLAFLLSATLMAMPAFATRTRKPTHSGHSASSNHLHSPHKAASARSQAHRAHGQQAIEPERVTEIQQALAKDGSYSSAPNGKWDESTVAAMKKFQTTHALNPSGKLDALTLEKLGLGSTTAGVAEPVAPPA